MWRPSSTSWNTSIPMTAISDSLDFGMRTINLLDITLMGTGKVDTILLKKQTLRVIPFSMRTAVTHRILLQQFHMGSWLDLGGPLVIISDFLKKKILLIKDSVKGAIAGEFWIKLNLE